MDAVSSSELGFSIAGLLFGGVGWFMIRYVVGGFFTVNQNERAVKSSFGRAERMPGAIVDDASNLALLPDERERYRYPNVRMLRPGFYFKWPWERVHKASVAVETVNMAYDPEARDANRDGSMLEAVTKDQLNTGLVGQIRTRVSEQHLYAYLFAVKRPMIHIMGYFVSVLRQRIASFEAPPMPELALPLDTSSDTNNLAAVGGVSINDLRKNLRALNEAMDRDCTSSAGRYGIVLDASLITGIEPPHEVESALAAINTAHNQVSADISLAQAGADQKLVQSRRAVEIKTLDAQAEVEPLVTQALQLAELKRMGSGVLKAYLRNVRLELFSKASAAIVEVDK